MSVIVVIFLSFLYHRLNKFMKYLVCITTMTHILSRITWIDVTKYWNKLNVILYFNILSIIPHRLKLLMRGIEKIKLNRKWHCLSFCTFSYVHCVVCSSSIYGFWLPLWYLQSLVDRVKRDPKPCKYLFSKQYMINVKVHRLNIQSKWEKEVDTGVGIEDWSCIYPMHFSVTKYTKLQDFQHNLVHRILITNSFLYNCGLKETDLYTFYTDTKERQGPDGSMS